MSAVPGRAEDVEALVAADHWLAAVVEQHGWPPDWSRPPTFRTLVLQILEQQISLDAAAAHFARLRAATGGTLTPTALLALGDRDMLDAGVSRQKRRYLRALATDLLDGRLDLRAVAVADDARAIEALTSVVGIGPWTAEVFLLFALGRRDRFPAEDRALQVSAAEVLDLPAVPTAAELGAVASGWAPRRSAAAVLLWHAYLSARDRTM